MSSEKPRPNTKSQEEPLKIDENCLTNAQELRLGDKLSTTMYYSYMGPAGPYRSRLLNEADGAIY